MKFSRNLLAAAAALAMSATASANVTDTEAPVASRQRHTSGWSLRASPRLPVSRITCTSRMPGRSARLSARAFATRPTGACAARRMRRSARRNCNSRPNTATVRPSTAPRHP